MAGKAQRIGVIGASSLLGKELSEELGESTLSAAELVLLDAEAGGGAAELRGRRGQLYPEADGELV